MLYNVIATVEFTVQVHADSEDEALENAEKKMKNHNYLHNCLFEIDDVSYVVDEVMNDDGSEIQEDGDEENWDCDEGHWDNGDAEGGGAK